MTDIGEPIAIIEDLHVSYTTYLDQPRRLRSLATKAEAPRRKKVVRAVKGVNLVLRKGEYFGLIGSNGSGKSTLLAAMTGLLPVDAGRIRVKSRPRLLGVGVAAMRGGVSGRLNLIIGGLAVGLTYKEINEKLDDLIEFVGIGDAIDRPLKSYSSGMRARLNFTVATLTQPDILLVDEALAVGDAAFIARSKKRIDEILADAGTVIMVSHNVDNLIDSCDRIAWLKAGEIRALGDPTTVGEAYLADAENREPEFDVSSVLTPEHFEALKQEQQEEN